MITSYECECCEQTFYKRKVAAEHEKHCRMGERLAEMLETLPKEINKDNVSRAYATVDAIRAGLGRLGEHIFKNSEETFYLGGQDQKEDGNAEDDQD